MPASFFIPMLWLSSDTERKKWLGKLGIYTGHYKSLYVMMSLQLMPILRRRRRWCRSWRFSLTLETMWTLSTCWGPALSEVRGAARASTPNISLVCYVCIDCCFTVIGIVSRGCVKSAHITVCRYAKWWLCPINTGLWVTIRYWAVNTDQLQPENVMQMDRSQIYCAGGQY